MEGRHQPINVNHAYSRDDIPADMYDIATPEIARRSNHLREIAHHVHYRSDVEIGMLIGRNVPTAFQPLSVIYGKEEEPWAEQYKFGWTIIGRVCLDESPSNNKATVNRVSVIEKKDGLVAELKEQTNGAGRTSKDTTSPKELREMMQLDYSELYYSRNIRGTEQTESAEDRRFKEILTEAFTRTCRVTGKCPSRSRQTR